MILLVFLLITLHSCSCYAVSSETIETPENVYIDTLIQKYLSEETSLWDSIYTNSSDRSSNNVEYIKNRIRTLHYDIAGDRYLDHVMSVVYMEKFKKYVDFYNLQTNAEGNEQNLFKSQTDSYMTVDMTFNVYNYTRVDRLFREIARDSESLCSNWSIEISSTNQNLFMFYEILSANVLTSYMKSQRSNMLQVVNKGFEKHDSEILRTRFNLMYHEISDAAKEYMRQASKLIWMCDRNATNENINLQQVTNFLRGYIDNEINLNAEGSCSGTCSDYKFARNYGCSNGTFCYEQQKVGEADPICRGTIIDCNFIDDKMEICPSVSGRNRRYEYINYGCTTNDRMWKKKCNEKGRYFGPSGNCETKPTTMETFRNTWLTKCTYCFCYCDEHDVDSDRYFSLQPVVSDNFNNMVVTGVALTKRHGIFSWTITQSKLLKYGRVQQFESDNRKIIFSDFRRTDPGITDGVDYHTLSWANRSVNLDILTVPPGCVVTGVRFTYYRGHLSIEIRSTRFDFNTGLLLNENVWLPSGNVGERKIILLERPEPPTYYDIYGAYLSIPDFEPNKFIKFRPSDEDKDVGQSTVPFIDTQMVRPKNLTPLSGIGIYYKGKPGLGGFIAPTLVVYDFSSFIGNKS